MRSPVFQTEDAPLTDFSVTRDLECALLGVIFTNDGGNPVYPISATRKGNQIVLEMSDETKFILTCVKSN